MDASSKEVIELIGKPDKYFFIPTYQRKYTWDTHKEIKTLLNDLEQFLSSESQDYFLGTIIVKVNSLESKGQEYILVDGQQRITTMLIMIVAMHDSILNSEDDKDLKELKVMLQSRLKTKDNKFKLNRIQDESTLQLILSSKYNQLNHEQTKSNYAEVYSYFLSYFKKYSNTKKIEYYNKVICNIKLAIIQLNREEDEFLVFESINSKGKNLSSADLIKNFVMMSLSNKNENESIDEFENIFLKDFSDETLLDFYRQIIAIETGKLLSKSNQSIYYHIKNDFTNDDKVLTSEYIKYLIKNKKIWEYINNTKFKYWTKPLFETNKMNFYAVIHVIVENNSEIDELGVIKITNEDNLNFGLKFLSKLVVGRTLVSFGRVEGNRAFAKIASDLNNEIKSGTPFKKAFQIKIIDKLSNSSGYERMPSNEEINDIDSKKDLYTSLKGTLKWILLCIEEKLSSNEVTNLSKITIEHIFPQSPSEDWEKMQETSGVEITSTPEELSQWLHTLGNLSITENNSALGNKPFVEKKKILDEKSYLKINKEIYKYEKWSVDELKKRAKSILGEINEIWF
ncbi:MAG: DUF262 domain-containing protein [Metamycoplasmataceae bacterium]